MTFFTHTKNIFETHSRRWFSFVLTYWLVVTWSIGINFVYSKNGFNFLFQFVKPLIRMHIRVYWHMLVTLLWGTLPILCGSHQLAWAQIKHILTCWVYLDSSQMKRRQCFQLTDRNCTLSRKFPLDADSPLCMCYVCAINLVTRAQRVHTWTR